MINHPDTASLSSGFSSGGGGVAEVHVSPSGGINGAWSPGQMLGQTEYSQ